MAASRAGSGRLSGFAGGSGRRPRDQNCIQFRSDVNPS